jgi:hypothetical protein
VSAAANETVNAPAIVSMAPNFPNVCEAPAPLITAPNMTNILHIVAAIVNLIIFVPTAVPNMFAASFAPNDHPINKPADKNNNEVIEYCIKILPLYSKIYYIVLLTL